MCIQHTHVRFYIYCFYRVSSYVISTSTFSFSLRHTFEFIKQFSWWGLFAWVLSLWGHLVLQCWQNPHTQTRVAHIHAHTDTHTPISDSAGAQQDFGVSAPFSLQHDIYIHRLIIYKDLLHAAVEARQLGHAASRVIGLRTTCKIWNIHLIIFYATIRH